MWGAFRGDALFIPAMILILLGAFTKSAQFRFTSGRRMRWKHRLRLVLIFTPLRWLRPESIWWPF